jgi:hypothetical protein
LREACSADQVGPSPGIGADEVREFLRCTAENILRPQSIAYHLDLERLVRSDRDPFMIADGVPAWASRPIQIPASRLGMPCSADVGSQGNCGPDYSLRDFRLVTLAVSKLRKLRKV